jgi:hypothetical protein
VLELDSLSLTALPEAIGRLVELKKLTLWGNMQLTALPAGLGRLRHLEELDLDECTGLAALVDLQRRVGLPALLAHIVRVAASLQRVERQLK